MGKALPTPQSRDSGSTTNFSGHLSLHNPVLHIMLIIILGLLAYSNTFNVPFQFDDGIYIVDNPVIKDLQIFQEPSKVKDIKLPHSSINNFFKTRFVALLTFALNYKIHGLDVTGYHIFNLSIHILNALLVYWLVVLTFKTQFLRTKNSELKTENSEDPNFQFSVPTSQFIALFSGLLFVSHPIQTQAVTYIWQRVTSLATFFYLLSLVMYIRFRIQNTELRAQNSEKSFSLGSVLWYLGSVLSAVFAMLTKEIAFTLPVVIILYEFMFFKGKIKRRIINFIPFLLTMLIIPLSRVGIDKPLGDLISDASEATRELTGMSRWDYLFTQFRVIVTYIRLLFLPINQNLDYDYPVSHSFLNPNVFLSFLFLLSVFCLGVYLFYRSRFAVSGSQSYNSQLLTFNLKLISFGIFWFFITLSVESSIIPIKDVFFEHRMYLSSVGVFIAISASIVTIINKLKNRWLQIEKAIISILALILIVLACATYVRNIVWHNEISLWEDVVKKSPNKAMGYNNLGYMGYYKHGLLAEAIEAYKIALKINPDLENAYINLGLAYYKQGQTDKAIEAYQKALNLISDDELAFNNLGLAYAMQNNLDQAIYSYKNALKINPDYAAAHFNLGIAYLGKGLIANAGEEFGMVLRINPGHYQAAQFLNYISRH